MSLDILCISAVAALCRPENDKTCWARNAVVLRFMVLPLHLSGSLRHAHNIRDSADLYPHDMTSSPFSNRASFSSAVRKVSNTMTFIIPLRCVSSQLVTPGSVRLRHIKLPNKKKHVANIVNHCKAQYFTWMYIEERKDKQQKSSNNIWYLHLGWHHCVIQNYTSDGHNIDLEGVKNLYLMDL